MKEDKLLKTELCGGLQESDLRAALCRLYGADAVDAQLKRYRGAAGKFEELFGSEAECGAANPGCAPLGEVHLFRAPGRIRFVPLSLQAEKHRNRSAS